MAKKLGIGLGLVVLLLVVAYFVLTNSSVLKAMVLPRLSTAFNSRIDAERIVLRPLSGVAELHQAQVTPNGAETLLSVPLARVRYRLFSILGGTMAFDEVLLNSPTVSLVSRADGTSNVDPILKALDEEPSTSRKPQEPGKPLQLDLQSFVLQNATINFRSTAADGSESTATVTGLAGTARNLKNGEKGRVELGATWNFNQKPSAGSGSAPGSIEGRMDGAFDIGLTQDLLPANAQGRTELQFQRVTGAFEDFRDFATVLTVDLATNALRQGSLEFTRGGAALGSLTASGPIDLNSREANLRVDIVGIDKGVLNLAGATMGLDFGNTRFDGTNRVQIASGGERIALGGLFTGRQVSVSSGTVTMPPLDLNATYDLVVDLTNKVANLNALQVRGRQGGRDVLASELPQPMHIVWGQASASAPDATLNIRITDLRLADWAALTGAPIQGTLNAQAAIGIVNSGKDLNLNATASMRDVSGVVASNEIRNFSFSAQSRLVVQSFATPSRQVGGTLNVSNLTGRLAMLHFDRHALESFLEIGFPEDSIDIRQLRAQILQPNQAGGTATIQGRWNLERGAGNLSLALQNFTATGLRPFLQELLGEKQLRSANLVADLRLQREPAGATELKATADLKNLVVHDPSGSVPESPLAAAVAIDAGGTGSKLTIRQGDLKLTPTQRARNELHLTGDLDFTRTNALRGALKLNAESLDVTPYFELFAGKTNAPAPQTTGSPAPSPGGPQKEPDPIQLPIELLTADATIGKLYLRDIAIENWKTGVRIEGSRVTVQPLQLSLNGAPVEGAVQLNLGVPGYEYNIRLTANQVPVKPLASSFIPVLKGRIEGAANASVQIQGAGTTGVNLQKHLNGQLGFAVTNANLKLTDATPRQGILGLLTSLLATTLNIRELRDHPIMDIVGQAKLGEGRIDVTQGTVRSASLAAGIVGSIPIANDLMQSSLNLPVDIALHREVARRARLIGNNEATNHIYVPIPPLATIEGTLGEPSVKVDKGRAALLVAQGIGGLLGSRAGGAITNVGNLVGGVASGGTNAVGNLIRGVGQILRGPTNTAATNATATNPPPANTRVNPPVGGLLRGLFERKTNPPPNAEP